MKNILKALLLSCGIILILIVSGPKLPRESISKDEEQFGEKRGIFISYIELSKYLKNKSAVEGKENIDLIIKNIKELGFNEVIVKLEVLVMQYILQKYFLGVVWCLVQRGLKEVLIF